MFLKLNYLHWLLILPVLILYVNCDGYKPADSRDINSQTCHNSAKHSLKLQNFDASKDCSHWDDVVCEKRSFRPDLPTKISLADECLNTEVWGDICIEITYRDYDTSGASLDSSLYEPGASYNYQEYNCYFASFKHHGEAIFNSSHELLNESLNSLYKSCVEGDPQ